MRKVWLVCAAVSGLIATIIAALAAHALQPSVVPMVRETVGFQGWQTAALFAAALLARQGGWAANAAAACLTLGLLLFCGAVYALAFGIHLPMVAPTGGFLLMAGWLLIAAAAWRA
jgi:uncharacterized membrane protein YgdD (TMEM256/DUF423 family)